MISMTRSVLSWMIGLIGAVVYARPVNLLLHLVQLYIPIATRLTESYRQNGHCVLARCCASILARLCLTVRPYRTPKRFADPSLFFLAM